MSNKLNVPMKILGGHILLQQPGSSRPIRRTRTRHRRRLGGQRADASAWKIRRYAIRQEEQPAARLRPPTPTPPPSTSPTASSIAHQVLIHSLRKKLPVHRVQLPQPLLLLLSLQLLLLLWASCAPLSELEHRRLPPPPPPHLPAQSKQLSCQQAFA